MSVYQNPHHPRFFTLALDGATFDLLEPWMEQGHLPNLRQLYQSGVHGRLESTYPPLTAPAWASFITGKSPANHGLFEFFHRHPESYQPLLTNRFDIDGRSIWRVLSDADKRVGVLGVPLTWPPEQVNGYVITGLLTPRSQDVVFTYPEELAEILDIELGGYQLQHTEKYVQSDPRRLVSEERAILENKFDAALFLLRNMPSTFFMMHILGSDVLQHGYWHFMDPNHPQYSEDGHQEYGNVIRDYFIRLDQRLGELLTLIPEDCYVMVMSDHGFGPLRKYLNLNTWLMQEGFLKLKRNMATRIRNFAFQHGYHYRLAWEIGSRIGLVRWIIRIGRGSQDRLQRKVFLSLDDVDWHESKVYSSGNFGQMYVNKKGREPQGIVELGEEYDQVLQELENALRSLRDPETGEQVVTKIWRGSELWQGRYSDRAPDLFFFTKDMEYKAMGLSDFGSQKVFEDLFGTRAHHHMEGIFMLSGPGVKVNTELSKAHLVDLAPTIYHLLGVPIPVGLDGRVLTDSFLGELATRPIVFEDHERERDDDGGRGYTAEDEKALTELLRDLGYVT